MVNGSCLISGSSLTSVELERSARDDLQAAQLRFSLPWGQGLHAVQLRFSLP
jgi:hypothetical protein